MASTAGCGPSGPVKEIGRASGRQADEVIKLTQLDTALLGKGSVDDQAVVWMPRFQAAANAYQSVPPEVRGAACTVTTEWLEVLLTPGPMGDTDFALWTVQAVGELNRSYANNALAKELEVILSMRDGGEPYALNLLLINTAACEVVGL